MSDLKSYEVIGSKIMGIPSHLKSGIARMYFADQADAAIAALQSRLDAAERRLSTVSGLLEEAYEAGYVEGQNNPNGYGEKADRDACVANLWHIDALLSSAEPVKPECGCCGRTDRCDDDCDAAIPVQDCKPAKGGDGEDHF